MGIFRRNFKHALKNALVIGAGAFFLAILATLSSAYLLENISSLFFSLILLLIIIVIGIIFDIIGVAAAAAQETPLHAKAAKKIQGANEAILLVRSADKVASFCNDVVGDVSGTLSGAIGATIVLRIIIVTQSVNDIIVSTLMTSLIAALIVAGKSFGKVFAIKKGTDIIFYTGKLIAVLEKYLNIKLLKANDSKGRRL